MLLIYFVKLDKNIKTMYSISIYTNTLYLTMKNKRKTLFDKNLADIKNAISEKKVYKYRELTDVLNVLKKDSRVAQSMSSSAFMVKLQEQLHLKTYTVVSDKIKQERYSLFDITIYEFVNSLTPRAFFSMTTALNLMGASNFRSEFIFYSQEQKKKHYKPSKITQEAIDNAYKKDYRYTKSTADYESHHLVLLMPKFSGEVGVEKHNGFNVSSVNRALAEILINIQYFKGFKEVIKEFKGIKDRININEVYKVIKAFDLIYPYFQLLGFALNQIGFHHSELDIFKKQVSEFDFYTEKNKSRYRYDEYWRIYY